MDWTDPTASEPDEDREDDMSGLTVGFSARMRKRVASSQGKTILGSEVTDNKLPKWSGPDGEAQNNPTIITVDSSKWALDSLPALEGATQEAPKETCVSLEDGVPDGGPPDANKVMGEAPLEITVELSFSARLVNDGPHRLRGPGRLVLNSPVILMKWEQPLTGAPIPGPDTAQSIIDC